MAVRVTLVGLKEHLQDFVTRLYQTAMRRIPDASGLNHWLAAMAKGQTHQQVLDSFAGSPEFKGIVASFGL
ncbi:DUF4214 domain-containing protein [Ruminococcaceae bacterium OttesenSCG-928-A16]|nr:DUF4214 domain-containing protein [Ruminococcaceae bacterium OttesenSCG-928-A16]